MTPRSERAPLIPAAPYTSLPIAALATGERRLDAEVYLSDGYQLRRRLQQISGTELHSLADVWQPSRLKGVQVDRKHGTPFLAATQVFDIRPIPRKWLAVPRTPDAARRYVAPGWILVTCSGSVGDSI